MNFKNNISFGVFKDDIFDYQYDDKNDLKFVVFSDLHYGYKNYNIFNCVKGIEKLERIFKDNKDKEFMLNLGDFADNCVDGVKLLDELENVVKENGYYLYDGTTNNALKPMYSVPGNHEIAYIKKELVKKYFPLNKNNHSIYSFSIKNIFFLAYDAIFSIYDNLDEPSSIISTLNYTIPDDVLDEINDEIKNNIKSEKTIICFSHIPLKVIDIIKRDKLLEILSKYDRDVIIFEGHAHMENYTEYISDTNKIIRVFTLPAVTDYDTYKYYQVFTKDGKIYRINTIKEDL